MPTLLIIVSIIFVLIGLISIFVTARLFYKEGNDLYWGHKAASKNTALTLGGQLASQKIARDHRSDAVAYIISICSGVSLIFLGVLLLLQAILH